jgi:hypothetical protein
MPDRGRAVGRVVKWGVKYGPHVVVLAQQAREPAMKAAQTVLDRQRARRRALEHAATLREGTVLKTFDPAADHGEPVWVVFTGDEPVAAHPATTTPLAQLVAHSDLSTRVRPADLPTPVERVKALPRSVRGRGPGGNRRATGGAAGQGGTPGQGGTHGQDAGRRP